MAYGLLSFLLFLFDSSSRAKIIICDIAAPKRYTRHRHRIPPIRTPLQVTGTSLPRSQKGLPEEKLTRHNFFRDRINESKRPRNRDTIYKNWGHGGYEILRWIENSLQSFWLPALLGISVSAKEFTTRKQLLEVHRFAFFRLCFLLLFRIKLPRL